MTNEIQLSFNRENTSVRYMNYLYHNKTKGKMPASFLCATPKCYASISFKVNRETNDIKVPYEITHQNNKHIDDCHSMDERFFQFR